jgi:hypothetical protein
MSRRAPCRAGLASPLLARRSALEGHPLHYFSERLHFADDHAHDGAAREGAAGAVVGARHARHVSALRPSVWGVGSHDVSTHGMLHYHDEPNAHDGASPPVVPMRGEARDTIRAPMGEARDTIRAPMGEARDTIRAPRSLSPRPEARPNLDRPEARPQPGHGDRSPRGGGGGNGDGGGARDGARGGAHGGALGSPRGRISTSVSGGSVCSSPRSRSSSSSRLTYALVSPRPSRRGTSAAALEARAGACH